MSTRASIYYIDEHPTYVHVYDELLDDTIGVEIGEDTMPTLDISLTYEQAVELAESILRYANWPTKINERNMAERARHCWHIIDTVDEVEAADWEDTDREERHWMREARTLAQALVGAAGYIRG